MDSPHWKKCIKTLLTDGGLIGLRRPCRLFLLIFPTASSHQLWRSSILFDPRINFALTPVCKQEFASVAYSMNGAVRIGFDEDDEILLADLFGKLIKCYCSEKSMLCYAFNNKMCGNTCGRE